MRIWSFHPCYLDSKGLVALWRETLLAKNVLEGKTKGYKNHPQLIRFKASADPLRAINFYLSIVWKDACARNYNFDKSKFEEGANKHLINVTTQQLVYERLHLEKKLLQRDADKYNEVHAYKEIRVHPLFQLITGEIEPWEKI